MASIFTTAKPKRFDRKPRFANERKEFLEARIRKVKREMGLLDESDYNPEESIRGSFSQGTTHLRRRMERDEENGTTSQSRYIKLTIAGLLLIIIFYYMYLR